MILNYLHIVGTDRISIYKRDMEFNLEKYKRVGLDLKKIKTRKDLREKKLKC